MTASQLCAKCGKRPGTIKFTQGGALDLAHGFYEMRCEGCVLRAQIEHAEARAASLPDLRRRLAEFEEAHS